MPVTDYIGLLIQIPIVGIFVWFALQLIKILTDAIKQFTDSLQTRDEAWRIFFAQQEEANRAFLKQHGDANTNAIQQMTTRFADEIRNLTKEITELRRRNGNGQNSRQ